MARKRVRLIRELAKFEILAARGDEDLIKARDVPVTRRETLRLSDVLERAV